MRGWRVGGPRGSALAAAVGAAIALAGPVGPTGLSAQTEPATARQLTLGEALDLARGGNPTYRRAENDVLLNGTEMRATWLTTLLPTASLSLSTGFSGNLQRIATDNFGNPIANPAADWVYFSNTYQVLDLSWSVAGLSLVQEHRAQSLVNRGRELTRVRALTDVEVQVRRLYMDALEQKELLESEAALLEARRIDQDVAERLFSLALRTRVDVLNAELAVEQQALAQQQQEGRYRAAVLELRAQLGADVDGEIDVVDDGLPVFDPSGLDADALAERALGSNPGLLESVNAVDRASHELGRERNAWWPRLELGTQLYRRSQSTAGSALFDPAFGQDLESQFFVRVSLPIFGDYFATRERTAQASVALDNERENQRERRLTVEKDVRGAVLTLQNEWASLRYAERAAEIAEEALRLARERYRLGTGTFEELRQSIDAQGDTRRQLITSRHTFVEALLTLEEAVGGPVRPTDGPADAPVPGR